MTERFLERKEYTVSYHFYVSFILKQSHNEIVCLILKDVLRRYTVPIILITVTISLGPGLDMYALNLGENISIVLD